MLGRRLQDSTKWIIIGWEGVNWIHLVQNMHWWRVIEGTVTTLRAL